MSKMIHCDFEIAEGYEDNVFAKKDMENCVNTQLGVEYAKQHKQLVVKRYRYWINGEERILPVKIDGWSLSTKFLGTVYTYGIEV